MIQASAPAKIILVGEHAVVYGQPAIAVPVSALRATVTVESTADACHIIAHDLDKRRITLGDTDDPLAILMRHVIAEIGISPPKLALHLRSDIPIASGLGSGAATSTAVARALCRYANYDMPVERLNALVYEAEKSYHGTPSGIDNTVIVYETPIYFVRDKPIERITNREPLLLLIADTGQPSLTKKAVGDVRHLVEEQRETIYPIVEKIGGITQSAREAMQQADLSRLGTLMLDNHRHLQTLTVSSPMLDSLVDTAIAHGALGAKLSGGGRGGNMITIVTADTQSAVTNALRRAGASHVFSTVVESTP